MIDALALLLVGILIGIFLTLGYSAYLKLRRVTAVESPIPYPAETEAGPTLTPRPPRATHTKAERALWDTLTRREKEAARLIARGSTNQEAALHMQISPRTVDSYLRNVYSKLDVRSRTELANFVNALQAALRE